MMHNPCTPDCFAAGKDMDDYAKHRLYIIFKIKGLICLDFQDITAEEKSLAGAKGGFARTASPRESGGGAEPEPSGPVAAAVDDVEVDDAERGRDDSRAYLGYSPYKHLAHDSEVGFQTRAVCGAIFGVFARVFWR